MMMEYLKEMIGEENFKQMLTGSCPYLKDGKCHVYEFRFAGCRIFCCNGSAISQSELTESVLTELKELCTQLNIPYHYQELSKALNKNCGKKHSNDETPATSD